MLEAYVDESGTEERWCAVAALVGLSTYWRKFEEAWQSTLSDAGVPYFHATEFFAGGGLFQGWTRTKRDSFIDALTGLITDGGRLKLIASAVDRDAFFARNEHERRYLTGACWDVQKGKWTLPGAPTKPYYLALSNVWDRCYRTPIPTDMFHDQQCVYAPHALSLHAEAKKHRLPLAARLGVGALVFESKTKYIALQAADLAAYLTFVRVTRGRQPPNTERGRAARAFKSYGDRVIVAYDAQSIEGVLRISLPEAIRNGRMPSQQRAARREAVARGRQRQRNARSGASIKDPKG